MAATGISVDQVCHKIGDRIEDQVRFAKLEKDGGRYFEKVMENIKKNGTQSYSHKSLVLAETERRVGDKWVSWSKQDKLQLGALLLDLFAENVFFEGEPILNKETIDEGKGSQNKSKSYLVPCENVSAWIEEYKSVIGFMAPAYGPCVIPPRNWTTPTDGGYHLPEVSSTLPMVKCRKAQLKRLASADMPAVYGCLNNLQNVSWQVNDYILDTLKRVMASSKEYAIPRKSPYISKDNPHVMPASLVSACAEAERIAGEPVKGAQLSAILATLDTDYSLKAALSQPKTEAGKAKRKKALEASKLVGSFRKWKRESADLYTMEKSRRAKYMEVVRLVKEAEKYSAYPDLYFVHSLDFRGRVNVRSSVLSSQGGDAQKAMLKFSSGARLGKTGMYWLAVQGANVWGEDKLSFDDRVKFIEDEDFTETVRDIIADPMSCIDWVKADKPWQFLSWAKEWSDLQDWIDEGKNPEDFISHVAVAQDGSCSGIQHYSAMLLDHIGGAAVNLTPSDKPQDIYGEVARVVVEKMSSELDCELTPLAEAWLLIGINRNMTKKPVMTLPYGSSQLTCRESIMDYLSDLQAKENKKANAQGVEPKKVHPFSMEQESSALDQKEALRYATGIVWSSISEVVVAARQGMAFIKGVTGAIADAGEKLEWTTPSGMIVQQEIFETTSKRVKTQLMGTTFMTVREETKTIDSRAMKSSCAPNFVHSMDASHLQLFCNTFGNRGHSIAVIHDSFGTHAGYTEELRDCLREEFVNMYKNNDVLANFIEENESRTMIGCEIEMPEHGKLDLDLVLVSPYAFG